METAQLLKENTMNLIFSKIVLLTFSLCIIGCAPLRYDGPYSGRVIDADTKQPIEGAVVHGNWSKVYPNPTGSNSEYYDSTEVLTDKNGNFKISGQGLLLFSFIDKMSLTIFKSGYGSFQNSWEGLKSKYLQHKVNWENDNLTIMLRHLSLEERKKRSISMPSAPNNKRKLFIREYNKEVIDGKGYDKSYLLPEED